MYRKCIQTLKLQDFSHIKILCMYVIIYTFIVDTHLEHFWCLSTLDNAAMIILVYDAWYKFCVRFSGVYSYIQKWTC